MTLSFVLMLGIFILNVLTPGASFVLTISNAMTHGRRTGLLVALGLACVDTLFAAAATVGLAALISQNILVVKGISLIGGLWFVYGGLYLLFKGKARSLPAQAAQKQGALSAGLAFQLGFTAGAFNPQAILFFSSMFLAALTVTPSVAEGILLVAGVAICSVVTRGLIVTIFTMKRVVEFYHQQRRRVEALSGGALAAFGLKLAVPAAAILIGRFVTV